VPLNRWLRYRSVIYLGTVLTGMTGLIYQVVWQKYLSFLVGSETRSVSLVVAVFLGGLAAGYRFWGRFTESTNDRGKLLRIYGLIEIGIGLYAALFPLYFKLITAIGHAAPQSLFVDLGLAILTLVPPTFLMGATIPLLVSVVPEGAAEVNSCHARIYGINAMGACAGAFGASFILLPALGLFNALMLAAAVNVAVGVGFMLNPLNGRLTKESPIETLEHNFPIPAIYAYTLITGAVTLSLEVLFVRLLGMSVGNGPHNFAIVVGVFILGLAIGSLLISGRKLSVRALFTALTGLILYSVVVYHTVPYWPYWMVSARNGLTDDPSNYGVYLLIITGVMGLLLLPFLIPLGMMLPLVYALLPKSASDYGKKCGWVYFYNTIGTALGAIFFSYLLLYFLELDHVFKLDIALLSVLAIYLLTRQKRPRQAALIGVAAAVLLVGPGWDRSSYHMGLFRRPELIEPHQGMFAKPTLVQSVISYEDGPDSSVTVAEFDFGQRTIPTPDGLREVALKSRSLVVNGNGDGDTIDDYSTNTLAALLPYLNAPDRGGLKASVIGLGTGTTGGTLALGEDVAEVTVVEISSTLVDALPHFDSANHGLSTHPKAQLLGIDGFKYLSRLKEKQEIIISATSPPWVVGVENLMTPHFYSLAHDALTDDGVFLQWFPLYALDREGFRSVLANVSAVFPHRRLYRISFAELGILASKQPLPETPLARRFNEPGIFDACAKLRLDDIDLLMLAQIYETDAIDGIIAESDVLTHTLVRPGLAYTSDRMRFMGHAVDITRYVDPRLERLLATDARRAEQFTAAAERHPEGLPCTTPSPGLNLFCSAFDPLLQQWQSYRQPITEATVAQQLQAYDALRQARVVLPDENFTTRAMNVIAEHMAESPENMRPAFQQLTAIHENDGMVEAAIRDATRLLTAGQMPPEYHQQLVQRLEGGRLARQQFIDRYRGN